MSSDQNWVQNFQNAGAIWGYREHGPHASFEMAELHCDFYLHTGIIANNKKLVSEIGHFFANLCRENQLQPDWIISYVADVANGITFASELSKLTSSHAGCVDLQTTSCDFDIQRNETVLIVTDDIVSGRSLGKTIDIVEAKGGKVLQTVLTIGNFSGQSFHKERKIISLIEKNVETWLPEECPLCKRGSAALPVRQKWDELTT